MLFRSFVNLEARPGFSAVFRAYAISALLRCSIRGLEDLSSPLCFGPTRDRGVSLFRAKQGRAMRQTKFRGNVFVANLPLGYSDEQLAQTFDEFGLVLGAYLAATR